MNTVNRIILIYNGLNQKWLKPFFIITIPSAYVAIPIPFGDRDRCNYPDRRTGSLEATYAVIKMRSICR